ncbi:hypothetical protein FD754_020317, partial [Muntiacus muntjak]
RTILGIPNEEPMDRVLHPRNDSEMVGIVFNDTFSYRLKFSWGHRLQILREHFEYSDHCWALCDETFCFLSIYWQSGLVAFLTAINAAIIEVATNHSVMEKLTSVIGINMRILLFISKGEIVNELFIFICIVYFSPIALMYAGFIFIVSIFTTLVIKLFQMAILTDFMVVVIPFTLNGLPILTGLVGSLFTVSWGCLGFMALCLFNPFASTAGMAQISHQEYHVMIFFFLTFDTLLYLTLTLYFENILPDENGQQNSPPFFLKSSFWPQHKNTHHEVFGNEMNSEIFCDDSFESVSPEFHRKETIRFRNLKKENKGKPKKVQALQGICLDIYEGQLTAILGHSGDGSATIYNTQLSEIMNIKEIRNYTGFCLQFNIYFDFLTVRESFGLFSKIKGIPPKEVEQEVKGVMMESDMHNSQDVIAKELSGGQKRKLTFDIAVLGEPQILLLDKPIARLDPFSRHLMWNFLKEWKTTNMIPFSTQFMNEADILPDRKLSLSNGKLGGAGLSLFLKQKWGIGYHLSLHRNERCDTERITFFITKHISDTRLTAEREEKLFADFCRDLENSSDQSIMNFGVSMTTLSEVFLNLKGRSAMDKPDSDTGVEPEVEQALCPLPEVKKAVNSAALLCFLKLRNERKIFLPLLVVFGIALISTICEKIVYSMFFRDYHWEFSPGMHFLPLEQLPQTPLTNLLIINNTGSNIEDAVQSLKHQVLVLEVDDARNRNVSEDPSYKGAIIESGGHKDYRFSVACNTKRMNCFPVLIGIVSNALLGIFYLTELIKMERSMFPPNNPRWATGNLSDFLLLLIVNCLSHYIGVSSVSLCPSVYWCGQALVDIPFYFGILSMHFMYYIFLEFTIALEFILALLFSYLIIFILILLGLTCSGKIIMIIYTILIWSKIQDYEKSTTGEIILLTVFIPYLQITIFLFIIWCLEMKYGKETMRKDTFFRISPRRRENCPNPEEPEEEDEDIQTKRVKTANVLTASNLDEKLIIMASCEVLGLLGHNGAGKSTSIKIITGNTKPYEGVVVFSGRGTPQMQQEGNGIRCPRYCPQENALWSNVMVREHLDLYAAVKGLAKEKAALSAPRLAEALKLQDQMTLPAKPLSEGVLGSLAVVLLEDPTTGMDPERQLQIEGRPADHPLQVEAEAVCDHMAIMVSGRLRCVSSIQHLKSKFGKDYLLEVKEKALTRVKALHTEILKLSPQDAWQESYSFMMAYKLPMEGVHPLCQAFSKLDALFLELSKEQEQGNFDYDVFATVR